MPVHVECMFENFKEAAPALNKRNHLSQCQSQVTCRPSSQFKHNPKRLWHSDIKEMAQTMTFSWILCKEQMVTASLKGSFRNVHAITEMRTI